MTGTWFNIALVTLCINIFIYIGAAQMGVVLVDTEGDMLSTYTTNKFNTTNMLDSASSMDLDVNRTTVKAPVKSTAPVSGTTFLEILNGLDIIFDMAVGIFNIAFAPLVLLKIAGIPYIIAYIFSYPLCIMFWLSIIQFFRGAS